MATARSLAIASENASIDASTQRATEARARPSALAAMAHRLQISEGGLMKTLKSTVFAKASDNEFMAMVVVCNEYQLNPLLKEIYAFPAKGGGIVPMVSVDGWIKIMNSHPQFDGIEFDYINDASGKTVAIEAIIHRKDRNRPIKVMEYLSECVGGTEPWKKSPFRMLRHRALIQCARVAFGFSGIGAEGDEDDYIEGTIVDRQVSLPPARQPADHDAETGEVMQRDTRGMTEVDEATARELDEGRPDEEMGEAHSDSEPAPSWFDTVNDILARLNQVTAKAEVSAIEAEYLKHAAALPDDVVQRIEAALRMARRKAA